MPAVVRFNPYRVSSDLELRIAEPYDPTQEHLDFSWLERPLGEDEMAMTLDLTTPEGDWRTLRAELTSTISQTELQSVLPLNTDLATARGDLRMLVSVRCPASKYRRVVEMEDAGVGRWHGVLKLERGRVRNVVELRPMIVRRTQIPRSPGNHSIAMDRGAIVAEGHPTRLIIDHSEPPVSGALDIRWQDFRSSSHPWRADHAEDVYHLDVDGTDPILWLNSRYASFRAAMDGRDSHGPAAVVRHLGVALIAHAVWIQLVITAAGAIRMDDESDGVDAPGGWRGKVLEIFLPRIYPERNEEERIRILADQLRSPDQIGTLMTGLSAAAQEHLPVFRQIEEAIRAGERET